MKYNEYNYSNWESKAQTHDENEIGEYLLNHCEDKFSLPNLTNILHIGLGSNSLYNQLKIKYLFDYTGLTKTILEYENVLPLQSCNYKCMLMDKYNPKLSNMLNMYDFIVDNNIASYADSEGEALGFFGLLLNCLNKNGKLLTHNLGLQYKRPANINSMLTELKLENEFKVNSLNGVVIIEKI